MGFKNIIMHLNDDRCAGFEEQRNVTLVSVVTPTHDGQCGTQLMRNKTHLTFSNTLYLANGPVVRGKEIKINFHCSYPLNMETSLKTAIRYMVSSIDFLLGYLGHYTVQMGFYNNSKYTSLYEGTRVVLPNNARLYVGIRVIRGNMSLFVLKMEDCFALSEPWQYTLIRDGCPFLGESVIKVLENGVSEQGRFSLQVYQFFKRHYHGYIHCRFFLCKKHIHSCQPDCSETGNRRDPDGPLGFTLHLGPVVRSDVLTGAATSHVLDSDPISLLLTVAGLRLFSGLGMMQPSFALLLILLSHRCSTFAQTIGRTEDISRLQPQLECGKSEIKVFLDKSLLTKMGFKNIIMHLNDDRCAGFEEQRNLTLVSVVTPTHDGHCGTQLTRNKTHSTFSNTLYLANGPVVRGKEIKINFSCSYPLDMETSLKKVTIYMMSSIDFIFINYIPYTVQMGFYRDLKYTLLFEGLMALLPKNNKLYVGIRVTRGDMKEHVLRIENCYVSHDPWHYTIIQHGCPYLGDSIIEVLENGVSEQARFSLHPTKFMNYYPPFYLHCRVWLCLKSMQDCKTECCKKGPHPGAAIKPSYVLRLGPIVRSDSMSLWAATSHGFQGAWMTLLIPAVLGFSLHAFP